jgi:hypothetical protein
MGKLESDRAVCEFVIDGDVKAVLEFMQKTIPTSKLIGVVDSLPQMGRLLWGQYPQEPLSALSLEASELFASTSCEKRQVAIV